VDLLGTITLDDASAVDDLASSLVAGGCTVEREDARTLAFAFPWGSPQAAGSLAHAWNEIVFFLRAWELERPGFECRISDVRFAAASDGLRERYAA
jgi:hypothetical protein